MLRLELPAVDDRRAAPGDDRVDDALDRIDGVAEVVSFRHVRRDHGLPLCVLACDQVRCLFRADVCDLVEADERAPFTDENHILDVMDRGSLPFDQAHDQVEATGALVDHRDGVSEERPLHLRARLFGAQPVASEIAEAEVDRQGLDEHFAVGSDVARAGDGTERRLDLLRNFAQEREALPVDIDGDLSLCPRHDMGESVGDRLADRRRDAGKVVENYVDLREDHLWIGVGGEANFHLRARGGLCVLIALGATAPRDDVLDSLNLKQALLRPEGDAL